MYLLYRRFTFIFPYFTPLFHPISDPINSLQVHVGRNGEKKTQEESAFKDVVMQVVLLRQYKEAKKKFQTDLSKR